MKEIKTKNVVNMDNQGNVIEEAFPVSKRTQKDHRKTSIVYTIIAILLHIIAFVPIIAVSCIFAVKSYNLVPYYTFWPFVGVIITVLFGLIYLAVTLIVTRRRSKSSIMSQTVKVAITYTCLTAVFGLILTYAFPDIISMATQNTMFTEGLYYNAENQAETNAALDREFILLNLLSGNLNDHTDAEHGNYAYSVLSLRHEEAGKFVYYENDEIQEGFDYYMDNYGTPERLDGEVLENMKKSAPRKHELYKFIYNNFTLNDFDYALSNTAHRRAFTLSMTDYIYKYADYPQLLKEGMMNPKVQQLFAYNFDSFSQDGYWPFDDPLLLYAQNGSRMGVPVILRLIVNEGWKASQPAFDEDGNIYYYEENNTLHEMYDYEEYQRFLNKYGEEAFKYTGRIYTAIEGTQNGTVKDYYECKYGFNEKGWMIFENGITKRPVDFVVLDMQGTPMDVTTLDLNALLAGTGIGDTIMQVVNQILPTLGELTDAVGDLLQKDVDELIRFVAHGASLNVCISINDENGLYIGISGKNTEFAMPGYMQASYLQSNNLLFAVFNIVALRNWFCLFSGIGLVLIIGAGVCRDCGKKTRERTEVARDRILRAKTAERNKRKAAKNAKGAEASAEGGAAPEGEPVGA